MEEKKSKITDETWDNVLELSRNAKEKSDTAYEGKDNLEEVDQEKVEEVINLLRGAGTGTVCAVVTTAFLALPIPEKFFMYNFIQKIMKTTSEVVLSSMLSRIKEAQQED